MAAAPPEGAGATGPATPLAQRLRYLLLVVLPLAVVLGLIWLINSRYQAARERYLTESYVRALGTVAEQTEGAINGLSAATDKAVGEWQRRARETVQLQGPRQRARELKRRLGQLLGLSGLTLSTDTAADLAAEERAPVVARVQVPRRRQTATRDDRATSAMQPEPVDSTGATLRFCRPIPQAVRHAAGSRGWGGAVEQPWICAEKDLGAIVRSRLRGSGLETLDVFVVDDSGAVLFERGNSGLRYRALRPAKSEQTEASETKETEASKRKETEAGVVGQASKLPGPDEVGNATVVRTVDIDGSRYRFFSHPLRLETGAPRQGNWAIAAVVPSDRMDTENRTPLIVLAGIPLVLILAALALPFLKLATMGRREALTRLTVFGVGVALALGAAFATTALLASLTFGQLRAAYDAELRRFANALEGNFADEMEAAYETLVAFRDRRMRGEHKPLPGASYMSCENGLAAGVRCRWSADRHGDARAIPTGAFGDAPSHRYPSWSFLVLAGTDGWQREKWTRESVNTAVLDMSADSAFKDVQKGDLSALGGDPQRPYALNVMTSPNTGQVLTVLSAPVDDADRSGELLGVAMMVADFGSVSDPMVAPDMGFAIIARSGQVIFHSNDRLRLYENLFTEVGDADPLRAAVFASRGGFFDLDYHGQPQRMLLRPLPDSDWSLLVFRDRDALRMLIVEVALVAGLLEVGLVVALLLWVLGARLLLGPGLQPALWPDPRAIVRYRLLLMPLAALPPWSLLVMSTPDAVGQLLGVTLAALIALSATLLVLTLGQAASTRRWLAGAGVLLLLAALAAVVSLELLGVAGAVLWVGIAGLLFSAVSGWEPSWLPDLNASRITTVRLYVAVAALLLINVAVIPAAALVRDAIAAGGVGMVRARQLVLAEKLATQRRRMAARYKDIEGGETARAFWDAHRHWTEPGLLAFGRAARPVAGQEKRPIGDFLLASARALRLCRDEVPPPTCWLTRDALPYRDDVAALRCEMLRSHPTAPIVGGLALRAFLEESLERRFTAHPAASNCTWVEAPGEDRVRIRLNDGSAPEILDLPNWDIGLQMPGWPAGGVIALGAALLALAGLAVVGWSTRRLFCVAAWDAVEPDAVVDAATGGYYLRPPRATVARLRQSVNGRACIDLAACDSAIEVDAKRSAVRNGPVLVLHWEHSATDPAWRLATLRLLEELVLRAGLWVDLVSDIDILPYLTSGDAAAADGDATLLTRWSRVLERLDKHRDDLPPAPLPPRVGEAALLYDECRCTPRLLGIRAAITADRRWTALSADALLRHIGDLAEPHYRRLWSLLTEEERLLLCHLAGDGFVGPRAAGRVRDLMRRGLIYRAPALRLMNESFRQFALAVEDRATIRAWERAAGASAWSWLRNGVLAVVVVGGVLLFLTQPESYARWVGLLGALTTVGGGMAQLLGLFQTRKVAAS